MPLPHLIFTPFFNEKPTKTKNIEKKSKPKKIFSSQPTLLPKIPHKQQ